MDSKTRTYQFALRIMRFIDNLPKDISTKVISGQLLRSATSIGANITEAKSSSSRKDFINFFNHALKSANETKYWLQLLKDSKKAEVETISLLISEIEEISNILASSILTLKDQRKI